MNHDVKDSINPVYDSLCQSVFYLPEIRSSVSQYLVQSRYRQVTFLVTVMHDPVIKHFDHIELICDDALPRGPGDTSPSSGVTNPSLDPCQPNRHFQRYP